VVDAAEWNKNTVDNPVALNAGALAIASQATGDLIISVSASQLGRVADVATGQVLTSGGVGAAPVWSGSPSFSGIVTAAAQPRCKAYKTGGAQSISDSTATVITFDAESFDVGTMHDNATNNTRLTIPSGGDGLYVVTAGVAFTGNATGVRALTLKLTGTAVSDTQDSSVAAATHIMQLSAISLAVAGDYFEVFAYQNSGGALNVVTGASVTFLSAVKVW